jgi:hypothetical protein
MAMTAVRKGSCTIRGAALEDLEVEAGEDVPDWVGDGDVEPGSSVSETSRE